MTTIEIDYNLFRKQADQYLPVSSPADLKIEAAIRAVDTNKRVTQVADSGQAAELHDYLLQVPWVFPLEGHHIDFSDYEPSRWDAVIKKWILLLAGASNIYRVYTTALSDAKLYLAVSTRGAIGQGDATDQTS